MNKEQIEDAIASVLPVYEYDMAHLESKANQSSSVFPEERQRFEAILPIESAYHFALNEVIPLKQSSHSEDECRTKFIDILRTRLEHQHLTLEEDNTTKEPSEPSSPISHNKSTISAITFRASTDSLESFGESALFGSDDEEEDDASLFDSSNSSAESDFDKKWTLKGYDSCNTVYIDKSEQWVLRRPLNPDSANSSFFSTIEDKMNDMTRTITLWQRVYPEYAVNIEDEGLKVPYFKEGCDSPELIKQEVIDIFKRTQFIISDPWVAENFRFDKNNKVVCVDLDFAVDQQEKLSQDYMKKQWFLVDRDKNTSKFDELQRLASETNNVVMATTCTLVYLVFDQKIPAKNIKDEYLSDAMMQRLQTYREHHMPITLDALERISKEVNVSQSTEHASTNFKKTYAAIVSTDPSSTQSQELDDHDPKTHVR